MDSKVVHYFQRLAVRYEQRIDQRERIYRISRDLTRESKRIISGLLRGLSLAAARQQLVAAHHLIQNILTEVNDSVGYWRFWPSFSPGLQEFVEACALWHFLNDGSLATRLQIQSEVLETHPDMPFALSNLDYILGVADTTYGVVPDFFPHVRSPLQR